ncbi:GMP synthase (glutamine-hydrolyzing) [Natronospira proteinivora]|uniref:GMP synthase (Glutamine-hydrolyzing) n=1 Tax=Natronospira proteinivora TaxID=1807133 RepID=A0ABT1G9S1_9GAMM|nr:glutamine amidotransferase [Natronospira proteinivora]MCP1728034.1 GMP synthase (glutamine-hydrolyzing) [Natronospira proteinivora]
MSNSLTGIPPGRVLVIRQIDFKGLGALGPHLSSLGYEIQYLDATQDDLSAVKASEAALVIILGGPPCAMDDARFPFLVDEMRLIEQCLLANTPVLGICLGAQLMARVLGGAIQRRAAPELGWWPVELTPVGQQSSLRFLDQVPVLHWHSDAIDLPPGCERLAGTEACQVQAFSQGRSILGLQFHPEVDARSMSQWLVAHVAQLDAHPTQSVERLRDETQRCAHWMNQKAGTVLRDWLSRLDEMRLTTAQD